MPASMHELCQLADKVTTSPTLHSSLQRVKTQAAAIWISQKHTRQMLKHKTFAHTTVPSNDRIRWVALRVKNTDSCTKFNSSPLKLKVPERNSRISTLLVHGHQTLAMVKVEQEVLKREVFWGTSMMQRPPRECVLLVTLARALWTGLQQIKAGRL